jgi:hypothetical protein
MRLALLQKKSGDFAQADQSLALASQKYSQGQLLQQAASAFNEQGLVRLQARQPLSASQSFQQAIDQHLKRPYPEDSAFLSDVYANLAQAFKMQKEPHPAVQAYETSARHAIAAKDKMGYQQALSALAGLYPTIRQSEKAQKVQELLNRLQSA